MRSMSSLICFKMKITSLCIAEPRIHLISFKYSTELLSRKKIAAERNVQILKKIKLVRLRTSLQQILCSNTIWEVLCEVLTPARGMQTGHSAVNHSKAMRPSYCSYVLTRKKVRYLNFCNFLQVRRTIFL